MRKLSLLLTFVLLFVFCSCRNEPPVDSNNTPPPVVSDTTPVQKPSGTENTTPEHTQHQYTSSKVEPTKTMQGYTLYTCECGDTYMEDFTGIQHKQETEAPVYRVLFIGNSYTIRSSLWNLFASIAESGGYTVVADHVTKGGWTLLQMADANDTYGRQVEEKLADSSVHYDVVILQEQSERPAVSPALFYDGVRALAAKIEAAGAKAVLYQTWGRKDGAETLTVNNWTSEQMTKLLAGAYEAIAEECGMTVSAVGSAFRDVLVNHPEIELYDTDKSHPTHAGSYLAALCHYATVYGKSPVGIDYKYDISQEAADILQAAAHKAVFGGSILSDSEKLSSANVTSNLTKHNGNIDFKENLPTSSIISVGITGDNGQLSSTATCVAGGQLTDEQIADLANMEYGLSIIGTQDMVNQLSVLNDGLWDRQKGVRLSFHFTSEKKTYGINGNEDPNEKYQALITFNFGTAVRLDAIGYLSGNMQGFAQAQDVYVSNDGVTWARIETACYDAAALTNNGTPLANLGPSIADSNGSCHKSLASVFFDMGGVTAKYVRIGIVTGVTATSTDFDMNTLELVIFGEIPTMKQEA